ncbi:sialic acid-binding Ig-like lectin 5 [Erethizon dorsatum]
MAPLCGVDRGKVPDLRDKVAINDVDLWVVQTQERREARGLRFCPGEEALAEDSGYGIEVQQSVTVQEGLCVFVPCTVFYPWNSQKKSYPAYGYWYQHGVDTGRDAPVATNNPNKKVQKETEGRFHLTGDPRANNCSLDIRDARKKDEGSFVFRLERGKARFSYTYYPLAVRVTALTHTPDILIPGTLVPGRPSNLTCSVPWACEQGTPPIFSWTSAALTSLGPRTTRSSVLTLSPRPQDHSTNLTCQVMFPAAGVTVERTVQLNVTDAPQSLTIQVFQGNGTGPKALADGSSFHVQEGQALRLVCVADSNPPAMLSWTRGNLTLRPSQHVHHRILELLRVELEDDGKYVCRAQHRLGSLIASVSLLVRSSLQLLGPTCSWEAEGLHCSCSSRAWPAPSLGWRLGQGLLEGNSSNASFSVSSSLAGPWANSSLSLQEGLCSSLRLSCETWNPHGTQSVTVLLLPEKPGPRTGVVQGAIGGAGVMVLLAVCLCFIFFMVKICRRKLTVKGASGDGTHAGMSTFFLGHQHHLNTSEADSTLDSAPAQPATAAGEEQELHYASLSFHGLSPREPRDQEDSSTTVYAEIRIRK